MPATFRVNALSPQWSLDEQNGKTTGSTVWQVVASEPTTLAEAVDAVDADDPSLKVPKRSAAMPGTTTCLCVKRSPRFANQTRMLVVVTCEYDSAGGIVLNQAKVSASSEQLEENFFEDRTTPTPKTAIFTNGRPFDEYPRRQTSIRVYDVAKNVPPSTTDASVADLENKVNASPVTIGGRSCAAKTLLVSSVSLSEPKTDGDVEYRELRASLRYHPDAWTQHYESRGLYDVDDDPRANSKGAVVDHTWPLTATGAFAATKTTKGADIALEPYATASIAALL